MQEKAKSSLFCMGKKALALALCLVLALSLLPATALAEETGTCGDSLTWTLDSDGTLTISGTGEMKNWISSSAVPWYDSISSVTTVVIKGGVTSIGKYAFYGCSSLTSVTIPETVTGIGSYAFGFCTSLTSVIIPNSVTSIDSYAFWRCTGLANVKISDSVTAISDHLFYGCADLTSVTIPSGVTSIGNYAFQSCTGLTNVTIPETVTSIGSNAFDGCTGLTSVTIPSKVTSIGTFAFQNCDSLTNVRIPEGVTTIENSTFSNCNELTSIEIPSSVISIAEYAFYYSNALKDVYYLGTKEQWDKITIGETGNDPLTSATVHYETSMPSQHEHTWGVGVITTEPTCIYGIMTYTCSCGATKTEVLPATDDHTWGAEEAISLNDGTIVMARTCKVCGLVDYDTAIEHTEHTASTGTTTKEATCVDDGEMTCICEICGEPFTATIPATGAHTWNDGEVTKAATCVEAGVKTYTCTVCKETKTETIPATGEHTWGEWKTTKEATCGEDGVKSHTCSVCGETETEVIPATEKHDWNDGVVTKAPSCGTGVKTYTCTVCGETKAEEIPATGEHTWGEGVITKAATCGETGVKTYTCTICGETKTEVIPATDEHTWDNGKVTTEPTCAKEGVKTYTCTVCGATKEETIPATGEHTPDGNKDCEKETLCTVCGAVIKEAGAHTWDEGVVATAATCGKEGEMKYTCTVCGETKTEKIPATGNHTWNDGVVTTNPTCTKEGVKTYTCTVCGETKTEAVPTVAHTPDGNTDCEKATLCTVCGAVIKPAGEHAWDEGEVTTAPTCTETGIKTFNCVNCDATKTETVDALGHDLTYTAEGAVITETCTRCEHKAKATVTVEDAVYTGEAIETAKVETGEDWLGEAPTVTYEDNVNAGTAAAKIAVGEVTATVNFEISKAEYTLTLENLSQYSNNTKDVIATVTPKDDNAEIVVEYETTVAEHTEWSTTAPTAVGTYNVRAYITASDNLVISEKPVYTEGTLEIRRYVYVDPDPTPVTPAAPATPEPEPVNAVEVYSDIEETDWYVESVNYVVENGLMTGYDEETFAPQDNLSRAMLMTIIARIDGVDTEGGETWYQKGMEWAVENGISDGSNPDGEITREQLITMLYRYLGNPTVTGTLDFADADQISDYAVAAMTWAVQNGIIQGTDVGTLNPQANATRAEAAAILMRFSEKLSK